jgi:hypothetical protein
MKLIDVKPNNKAVRINWFVVYHVFVGLMIRSRLTNRINHSIDELVCVDEPVCAIRFSHEISARRTK